MLTRRLSLMAVAAAFAVSSSAAMLQSPRPALADADDHHPKIHRVHNNGGHWMNGQWIPNNVANSGGHWVNGQWVPYNNRTWTNPGKHKGWKHKKHHKHHGDRD